jgi:hypothetical protein
MPPTALKWRMLTGAALSLNEKSLGRERRVSVSSAAPRGEPPGRII